MNESTRNLTITRIDDDGRLERSDVVAVEEPLEIELRFPHRGAVERKPLSITMRTPGNDDELALGFLYGEGIIRRTEDIESVEKAENRIVVSLRERTTVDLSKLDRHFYTTSSCGVCGKSSIDALQMAAPPSIQARAPMIDAATIMRLPSHLRERQRTFDATGGIHAAALFTSRGELITVREDVGRHNALDKIVGSALLRNELPLSDAVLLLSGRASFELLQKSVMAGIGVVCAVGAPSSLAVELAEAYGVTLIGFVKADRFNVYNAAERVSS